LEKGPCSREYFDVVLFDDLIDSYWAMGACVENVVAGEVERLWFDVISHPWIRTYIYLGELLEEECLEY
jgi:hypothetical protein